MNSNADKDIYSCYQCGYKIVVRLNDKPGAVDPMFTDCIDENCDGIMHSNRFNKVDVIGKQPKAAFRMPTVQEYKGLSDRTKARVDEGFPLLFRIEEGNEATTNKLDNHKQ